MKHKPLIFALLALLSVLHATGMARIPFWSLRDLFFYPAALFLGIWIYSKLRAWPFLDRWIAASMPFILLLLAFRLTHEVIHGLLNVWNSVRLTPTMALAYGYHMYYGIDSGPMLPVIYGPMSAIPYLPAALASSPTTAILIGECIAATLFFLPVLWLHLGGRGNDRKNLLYGIYAFLAFVLLSINSPLSASLKIAALTIHADAPALGLAATACAVLYFRKRHDAMGALMLSAILAILAVWAKQVAVPIVLALPVYLWLADGRRTFLRYSFYLVAAGLLVSAIMLISFDAKNLILNMFILPSQYPTSGMPIEVLIKSLSEMAAMAFVPGAIVIYLLATPLLTSSESAVTRREWIKNNPWVMLLLVGLFMIPTSVTGRMMSGGDLNALSYSLYFITAAATLGLSHGKSIASHGKLLIVIMVGLLACASPPLMLDIVFNEIRAIKTSPEQRAFDFSLKHPGVAYFPWDSLSSLMAEGKLYHLETGLVLRELAGHPVNKQHFLSFFPVNTTMIAYSDDEFGYIRRVMPGFSKRITVDELPGWKVYVRPSP